MSRWPAAPFFEVLVDRSGGNIKTLQSEYLVHGRYPIVDQGKDRIGGYTNDASRLCHSDPPVIVFGDHTRTLKYIDHPFAMGADGVKVLGVLPGWDPKYVFHYLSSLAIPSAGYSRHFKFLKERRVPRPPFEEQQRIAAILDQADELRTKRREASSYIDDLGHSIFNDLFGDPVENPGNFPIMELAEWVAPERPITYGILKPGPDTPGGVPYVRVLNIQEGSVDLAALRRTTIPIANQYKRSRLQAGDILLSIRGHVGRMAIANETLTGANITQDTARLAVPIESATYVMAAMRSAGLQRWMQQHVKGVAVKGINLADVKKIPIPHPPLKLQLLLHDRFSRTADMRLKYSNQLSEMDHLFSSLQSRAFAGQL